MLTLVAYLVSAISVWVIEQITLALFMPVVVLLKRIDAQALYWLEAIIGTMIGAFISVFFSWGLFGWLALDFSVWPVVVMLLLTTVHNAARLAAFRHSSKSAMEWSYAIGGTFGLVLGALFFAYGVSGKIVSSLGLIPVGILIYGLLASRQKSFPFWKLASQFPDEAYDWFMQEPCWHVYDLPGGQTSRPNLNEYNGPFYLYVPTLGRRITVYGRFDQIDDSEHQFVERYGSHTQ